MKKFLISLEKDKHRRDLFFSQADTAEFQVFSAINTMQEELEILSKQFNFPAFLQNYHRAVTKGEIGCTLSHLAVYQFIANDPQIKEEEYTLICEDDALFCTNFQQILDRLLKTNPLCDILLLGQSKIADFQDKELEINYPTTFKFLQKNIDNSDYRIGYPYKNYFAGTVAYLIKKSAINKILAEMQRQKPYWLADDFILFGNLFKWDVKIIRPLMVIENPHLNSNLENTRGAISHSLWKKLLKYPFKKLLAVKRNLRK